MSNTSSSYVISNPTEAARKMRKVWLLLPGCPALAALIGFIVGGEQGAYDYISLGLAVGFGLTFVSVVVLVIRYSSLQKAAWAKHTYHWYRATFPEHAHAKGRVSCRHCGGEHVRTERLLNQTYMRSHNCGQCGKTLYFSPEQR